MFTGGPIGLLSGGLLNPNANSDGRAPSRRHARRRDLRSRRSGRYMDDDADYYDYDYGDRSGYGGRRRRDGRQRGGLISGLVGGVIAATQNSPSNRPVASNDPAPPAPYGGSGAGRRSFDERDMIQQQREVDDSYGKTADYSQYDNAPAPYGRSRQDFGRGGRGRGGRGGGIGGVKRLMKSDVLYLQIVNLPSEAELAEARQQLAMAKQGR